MQAPLRTSHKQHSGPCGRRRSVYAVHLCAMVDCMQQRRARAPARIRRPRQRGRQDGRPVPEQHAPVVGPGRQPPPGPVRQERPVAPQTARTISTGCLLSTPRIKSTAGEPGRRAARSSPCATPTAHPPASEPPRRTRQATRAAGSGPAHAARRAAVPALLAPEQRQAAAGRSGLFVCSGRPAARRVPIRACGAAVLPRSLRPASLHGVWPSVA